MSVYEANKISDLKLLDDLRHALNSNQLQVTLQPKICLSNLDINGYEVLLRWTHPTLGFIPADKWIMMAEENDLMPQLTLWLVNEVALLQQNRFSDNPGRTHPCAINVSPSCLTVEFAHQIFEIWSQYKLPANLIQIEITESTQITNFKALDQAIGILRKKGIKVSLDDFGNGYATMQTLVSLEVDEIKIDRSLVQSNAKSAKAILGALVNLAKEIGMSTVFEGIETQEHLNLAKTLGVDVGQGYLFGRPQAVTVEETKHIKKVARA